MVPLLPSATEVVSVLGCRDHAGGSQPRVRPPPGVDELPVASRPRVGMPQLPGEIDRTIRDLVSGALGVYEVDDELLADHHRVADVLGVQATADRVMAGLCRRPEEVERRVAGRQRPTVATIEWVDPLMADGNWVPELVELAGGTNLLGEAGAHSPWLEPERLLEADPDRVLVVPCGWDLERAQQDLAQLQEADWWGDLRAVREGGVAVADGHQYFNRPGPRIVESAEIPAEWLHPDAATFGHEGSGFVRIASRG